MGKEHVMVNLDGSTIDEARKKFLNVSSICEQALKDKLGKTEVSIPEALKCEFCGREGVQETADTLNQNPTALVWLYPDEMWICNSCFKEKARKIPIAYR